MPYCPECKAPISDSAENCPHCGKRVIAADKLENIPVKTDGWQKFVVAVVIVLLIAIAFTWRGAEKREVEAAQATFAKPIGEMVNTAVRNMGLNASAGFPVCVLKAGTHGADIQLTFPAAGLNQNQAAILAQGVCGEAARIYVRKGYAPRWLEVGVSARTAPGDTVYFGKAVFNGNINAMAWEPAGNS